MSNFQARVPERNCPRRYSWFMHGFACDVLRYSYCLRGRNMHFHDMYLLVVILHVLFSCVLAVGFARVPERVE